MIAVVTIVYIALIVLIYNVLKIKPTPKNVAAMVVLGVVLIGAIVIFWQYSAPTSKNLVVTRYAVQIVPQVKGPVEKIYAEPNVPLKKGEDILFEIQKEPFEITVRQLTAALDAAKLQSEQASAGIDVAKASIEKSQASLEAAKAELDVARETQKLNADAIADLRVVQLSAQYDAAVAAVEQSKAALRQAVSAEEAEKKRTESVKAQLDTALFNLEQCVVRAPSDGFVTNWQIREGTMAVSLPFAPVGTFIDTSRTNLVASFPQNILKNVKPGDSVEISLKTRPGEIFRGTVESIIQATGEGQFVTSGQIESAADIGSKGMLAVKFKLEDEEIAKNLAMGTAGTAVIFTEKGKAFHVISKVVVRMNAWVYYLNPS